MAAHRALPAPVRKVLDAHGHFGRKYVVDLNDMRYPMRAALSPRAVAAAPTRKAWPLPRRLMVDQGNTPWCVDATRVHWERAVPIAYTKGLALGEAYRLAKQLDGYPTEEGTDWRSMLKVLQTLQEVETYVWAQSAADVAAFLLTRGSVALGAFWTESMLRPGPKGLLTVTGPFQYGHEVLLRWVDMKRRLMGGPNSWTLEWGDRGEFALSFDAIDALLQNGGDAAGTVQKALARKIRAAALAQAA